MSLATTSPIAQREAPQNLEAERSLLGGMLIDNRRIPEVVELIPILARPVPAKVKPVGRKKEEPPEPLFAHAPNQIVFETIMDLWERDRAVDLTTLGNELDRQTRYEAVGGAPYLASLEEEIVSTIHLAEYAQIVVEKWRLRSLLRAAEAMSAEARSETDDPGAILERCEQKIFEISQGTKPSDFVHAGEVAVKVMEEIEARAKHDAAGIEGLPSGFDEMDRMTTGFRPSNLIILAARPSMGKSALAMNIAVHASVKLGRPVGFFSLEMSALELNQRLLCTLARVPMQKVRSNRLTRQEIDSLHDHALRLGNAPLYIDDTSNISLMELRSRARRLHQRAGGLALIVVDYLQLMNATASGKIENRQQEVSMISRGLKALARDLQVPVIALSQLSRQTEQRTGKSIADRMPRLSDLRESGAIEQDADMVVFIHREFTKAAERAALGEPDLATIRIGKQRNGPTGDFNLLFRGELTEFVNIHRQAFGHS